MAINPSNYFLFNIVDTCSIWNVLSSKILYNASQTAKCVFSCTRFVLYECFSKPRKKVEEHDSVLITRLIKEREHGKFMDYHIDIEDLQEIDILECRRNLSKGELSSIVLAKKTRQAFLTDDQSARILAQNLLDPNMVQTIPHLFGWLFYSGYLIDSDKDPIIAEHNELGRPLAKYFIEMYLKANELKLANG